MKCPSCLNSCRDDSPHCESCNHKFKINPSAQTPEKNNDSENPMSNRGVLPTVSSIVAFIIVKSIQDKSNYPATNILTAGLIGGCVGAITGAIQYFFTSTKLKGTKLKKDIIVFIILLLVTSPLIVITDGALSIALIVIFLIKIAYFNERNV